VIVEFTYVHLKFVFYGEVHMNGSKKLAVCLAILALARLCRSQKGGATCIDVTTADEIIAEVGRVNDVVNLCLPGAASRWELARSYLWQSNRYD
jgi:hypothetical protein